MASRDTVNVLTIGNSFTDSLKAFFPQVAESAGCTLNIDYANHGGCELHRHWDYIANEERDHVYRMYQNYTHTMKEILQSRPWDVVTIQQASHKSWDATSFQPFGTYIRDYVKANAPGAELMVQQTWAYRKDDPRIMEGGAWGFDQTGMYERLTANYKQLAQDLGGLRIIPTGLAVQIARQKQPQCFINYDPALMTTSVWPDMPPQAWSLVGRIYWKKHPETGEMVLGRDTIHLNQRGQYLQACVWFAKLFERPTAEITFVPDMIGNKDAAFLREVAQEAVDKGI